MAGWLRSSLRGSAGLVAKLAVLLALVAVLLPLVIGLAGERNEQDAAKLRAAEERAERWEQNYWRQAERSDSIEIVNMALQDVGYRARAVADRHERLAGAGKVKLTADSTLADSVVTLLAVVADQDSALAAKDVRIEGDSLRIIILTVDRDAWHETADSALQVLADFRAKVTKELQKHDCSIDPFGAIGCPSRKTSLAIGGVAGFVAGVVTVSTVRSVVKPGG